MQPNNLSKKLIRLDIKKAFYSPFSDKKWKSKIFILTLLVVAGLFLLFPFGIYIGYCLQFMHNEIHDIKPLLPDWRSNFIKYLKYGVGFFVIVSMIFIFSFLVIFLFIKPFKVAFTLNTLIFYIISFAILCLYSDKLKFSEAFYLKNFFKVISRVRWEFSTLVLIMSLPVIICFWITSIGKSQLCRTIIAISYLLYPFATLILYNLIAQIYKKARSL